MDNTKILFCSSEKSKHDSELECYVNENSEIYINIQSPGGMYNFVSLTKETAIKLSKELKKQINILNNGL